MKNNMKRLCLLFVLLLLTGIQAFAQTTHTVTGKVTDEKSQGYPGAGVTLKGTHTGTVTDVNGDFMLDVPDGSNIFVIQAIGYNTVEVKETDQTVNVKLQPKSKELEGPVVTALAIRREKRSLGYSTTTLDNEELTSGGNTSALSGLQGKVAGANITSSTGGPGGSTRVILRGEKSILKDNNALIVVDGVIINNHDRTTGNELEQVDFGNSANDLDPDEIESVTVLGGPAAAALYGAAGANGAIMYTTKTGRHNVAGKSKMDITVKMSYTMSDVLKYPEYQSQFGQGAINAGIVDDRPDNFSWGLPYDNVVRPWGQIISGKQQVKPYSFVPNSMKQFYDHGRDLKNFVALSGGNESSTYYLSINSTNSNGVVPNTFYNKYSVRFNGTTQLSNNFYSTINVNYINSYSRVENSGQSGGGIMQSLLQIPTDIPISQLKDLNNKFNSMDFIDSAGIHRYGYFGAFSPNPYWAAKYYDNRNKTDRVVGNFNIGYKKGEFNVFNRVGIDASNDRSYYKTPQINVQSVDQTSFYPSVGYVNAGGYSQVNYTNLRFYNDLIGTYIHEFNHNFGMNALLGSNVSIIRNESLTATIDPVTNGLVIPSFYNFSNNKGPIDATNPISDHRSYAGYVDLQFNYRKEVFLEVTGRNEWSSTLEQTHNSYFYPGINGAWVFTESMHGGFKDKVLNYGKLRMGTAGVSNDAIPYANNSAGYSQSPIKSAFGSVVPPFNNIPAYQVQNTFGFSGLKPERTREFEIGADLSFLKNRITTSFTYYNNLTHDLITAVPLPPSSGYLSNYVNVGNISNKGIEVSLRGTPISTKYGLKWTLFGTYTHNVNNVESLNGNVEQTTLGGFSGMSIVAAVGHPYGTFYASDITYRNGQAVVDATTGLPIPTAKPVLRGSFQPKFLASWGTEVTYKGIKLYALFTTKQGGQFYSQNKSFMDFVGSAKETTTNNRNPYVWENSVYQVGTTNNYQQNAAGSVYGAVKFLPYNYWTTEAGANVLPAQMLVNATYIRLQEMALSYKIPQKYYQNTFFGSLEGGIFGNNLILWTAKSNKYDDPEATSAGATGNGQGFNFSARPTLRNYGAFLKVTF
jgi:TonB-linked SusC/RagA family outer membrane protein